MKLIDRLIIKDFFEDLFLCGLDVDFGGFGTGFYGKKMTNTSKIKCLRSRYSSTWETMDFT